MHENSYRRQLNICEDEFKHFMDIETFPAYELQTQEASIATADSRGYEVLASARYVPQNKTHSLLISTNLRLSKYLIFHEFIHMLDSEMYVKEDKARYAGLSGFTEYHASQIELMQLLGADNFYDNLSFSMDTSITTIAGETSVYQYINNKYHHAIELFSRDDFPTDINTLKTAIGVLYNYWGLRSICEMYAEDFTEEINNTIFLEFIPTQSFVTSNNMMHGWLDENKIEMSITLYISIIFPLIKAFNLV